MSARRRLPAAGAAVLSLGVLAACEKPAPIVTVVNAGNSTYAEANVYCFEGQDDADRNCATRTTGLTRLEIQGGRPLGIDVSKPLTERGWVVELRDPAAGPQATPDVSERQDGHYLSFPAPNLREGTTVLLTVRSLGSGDAPTGEWRFELVPR